jgi:PAS domain-containing protein
VIFAATADGVVIYDATGRLAWANPAAISVFGIAPAALAVRDAEGRGVERAGLPDARALRGETVQGERFIVTGAAGMEVAVQATAAPLRTGDAITGAIVIWHEVAAAESRNQHEQAQALSRRLVEAQEAERRRIARAARRGRPGLDRGQDQPPGHRIPG